MQRWNINWQESVELALIPRARVSEIPIAPQPLEILEVKVKLSLVFGKTPTYND